MVHKKRARRSSHLGIKDKFARLQMKPSLASYYVYTGFIYLIDTKGEDTRQDTSKHSQNGLSSVLS